MKHNVLVIEDNLPLLAASCEYLRQLGYRVDSCSGVDDAIQKVQERHYSIVLSDVRLGDGDDFGGIAVAEFINEHRHGTPVILLTACGDPDLDLRAMQCSVTKLLYKPQLLAQIGGVIRDTLFQTYDRYYASSVT